MSSPLELIFEQVPCRTGHHVVLIKFIGQLDESNVDEQSKRVYAFIEDNPLETHYIFELAGLEYMNSKSIGYLTDWYRKIANKAGQTKMASAQENILDILDTVGLTSIIEHHPSVDAARISIIGVSDEQVA